MPSRNRSPRRQRVVPRGSGPITSRNRPIAGSEYSVNNAANSLIYDPYASGNVYNRYFGSYEPRHLVFYLYDDPYSDPSTYDPTIEGYSIEEIQQGQVVVPYSRERRVSIKRNQAFTDGMRHDVVAVRYENSQHKVKFTGNDRRRNGHPYFYIEVYYEGEIYKMYGDFSVIGSTPDNSQQASFGKRTRVSSEVKYLRSLL